MEILYSVHYIPGENYDSLKSIYEQDLVEHYQSKFSKNRLSIK